MHWQSCSGPVTRDVKGHTAEGDRWHYLITWPADGRFLLCRWSRVAPTNLEAVRQAAKNTLEGATVGDCLDMAERFEDGHDLDHPAWKHPKSAAGEAVT